MSLIKKTDLSSMVSYSIFSQKIGSGWYGEIDLGLANTENEIDENNSISTSDKKYGFGFILEGGYSWLISESGDSFSLGLAFDKVFTSQERSHFNISGSFMF